MPKKLHGSVFWLLIAIQSLTPVFLYTQIHMPYLAGPEQRCWHNDHTSYWQEALDHVQNHLRRTHATSLSTGDIHDFKLNQWTFNVQFTVWYSSAIFVRRMPAGTWHHWQIHMRHAIYQNMAGDVSFAVASTRLWNMLPASLLSWWRK